jgi:hypothetical protein
MGTVFAHASVSLDGFIAGPDETGFDRLFGWFTNGDVVTPTADPGRPTYPTSAASAGPVRHLVENTGAAAVGGGRST